MNDQEYKELQGLKSKVRKLQVDKYGWNAGISTIFASDTNKFETAVHDIRYVNDVVVLEEYDTEEVAISGHKKWLDLLSKNLPESIVNKSTSKHDHHGYDKVFKLCK